MRTDSAICSLFNLFFALRRTIVALIIIEMYEYKGLQLTANICVSTCMIAYIAHFRPYKQDKSNSKEIYNEVCGFFV